MDLTELSHDLNEPVSGTDDDFTTTTKNRFDVLNEQASNIESVNSDISQPNGMFDNSQKLCKHHSRPISNTATPV
jgi:hypothetical protein